ncbi:DUF3857 domain-containing protein [Plebeiibacterium marinum]|uniref:DUF3857 and transglutaminase domain-containing protein n=1 Tax=Plebeiibacterium marinum TaxID=2992111 RepID=A0AAE3MCV4_9BACT|nr:DUF3857 domain-containing protein [Plebeiobacterium marinum]MCW3805227.1 DUF3857 and transglutaminase domain-containing protein [Plebeiobacterium marinum]
MIYKFGLFLIYVVFIISANIHGQDVVRSDYQGIITQLNYFYVIDIKDDSLMVTQTNEKEVELVNENSKGFTKDQIFFSSFTSVSDIDAYSLIPEDDGYKKYKVEQFQETHNTDASIFYDDSKTIQFAYPSLEKGSKTYLKYTINYKNPRFLRSCYFQSFLPVAHSKVCVKVHRDVELGFKIFNGDVANVGFKEYRKGKFRFYEWEAENVQPYHYSGGKYFGINHFSPHIALYIKSIKHDGVTKGYFGTTEQLYNYYYDFVANVNDTISDDLKNTVGKITAGLNDEDKAKAIYYWVHNNIKYVAYEHGYAGFIPANAFEVFQKRFGDCKGMSSLLKAMMDLAGLPTFYTWVGTRHIPYKYSDLPLPSADNHMIATRIVGDSLVVLDGTFKYMDYGVYPFHLQGKEILVGKGPGDYKVYKIPITPSAYSVVTDSVSFSLDGGIVKGESKMMYSGFNKVELAYTMDGVQQDNYEKVFSRIFNKGNNKFRVTEQQVSNLFEYEVPAYVQYSFEIEDYIKTVGEEIFVNMNLDKPYQGMLVDTSETVAPVQNDFYCSEKYITRFRIPQGYEVTYIPKDGAFNNEEFSYSMKYYKDGDDIVLEKEFKSEFFLLLEDKIPEWNKMIKDLNRNYRRTLVLKKNKL